MFSGVRWSRTNPLEKIGGLLARVKTRLSSHGKGRPLLMVLNRRNEFGTLASPCWKHGCVPRLEMERGLSVRPATNGFITDLVTHSRCIIVMIKLRGRSLRFVFPQIVSHHEDNCDYGHASVFCSEEAPCVRELHRLNRRQNRAKRTAFDPGASR